MDVLREILNVMNKVWHLELYNSGEHKVMLSQLCIALMLIFVGVLISKRVSKVVGARLERLKAINPDTAHVLQRILYYFMVTVLVLAVLPIVGVPITIFTVLGGAFAIGIGFGAQNLFNNLISGLIIMMEKPVRIGDIIELGNEQGRVEEVGNRCIRIRRTDGVDVLMPNSFFLEQPVVNWTLSDSVIKGLVSVGIAYGSDTELVRDLLIQSAVEDKRIHTKPEPYVLFEAFGDNALNFELWFWTNVNRPMDLKKIQSDLRFKIDKWCRKEKVSIAFPQRDVHLDTISPLEVKITRSD